MFSVDKELIALLKDKKQSLESQIQDREAIQVERLADPIDISTAQSNRDTAASNINRMVVMLREVDGALKRIEEGVYRICVECEENIPEKRLAAVPWAGRCIPCQEAFDESLKSVPNRLESATGYSVGWIRGRDY